MNREGALSELLVLDTTDRFQSTRVGVCSYGCADTATHLKIAALSRLPHGWKESRVQVSGRSETSQNW